MFFVHILKKKTRASNHLETCLAHEHAFLFHRVNRFEEIFGSICSQLALKKSQAPGKMRLLFAEALYVHRILSGKY